MIKVRGCGIKGWMRALLVKKIKYVEDYKNLLKNYLYDIPYIINVLNFVNQPIPSFIIQFSFLLSGYLYIEADYMNNLIYMSGLVIIFLCLVKIFQKRYIPNFINELERNQNNMKWVWWFSKHKNWNTICYVIYNYIHIWTIWHGIKLICIYIMRKINSVIQYLKRKSKRIFLFMLICKIEKIWILVIKGMYWIGEDIIEFTIKYILMIYYKIKVKIYSENIWKLLRWRIMVGIYGMVFGKYTLCIIGLIYIYSLLDSLLKKWLFNYDKTIKYMLYTKNEYDSTYFGGGQTLFVARKVSSLVMSNSIIIKKKEGYENFKSELYHYHWTEYRNICLFYIDSVDIYKQHKEEMYKDSSGKTILPILYKIKLEEIINKSINTLMVEWQYKDKMLQTTNDSEKKEVIERYFDLNKWIYYKWIDIMEILLKMENNERILIVMKFVEDYGFVFHIEIDKGEHLEYMCNFSRGVNLLQKDLRLENLKWKDLGGDGWRSCEEILNRLFAAYNMLLFTEKNLGWDRIKPYRKIWPNISIELLTIFSDRCLCEIMERMESYNDDEKIFTAKRALTQKDLVNLLKGGKLKWSKTLYDSKDINNI